MFGHHHMENLHNDPQHHLLIVTLTIYPIITIGVIMLTIILYSRFNSPSHSTLTHTHMISLQLNLVCLILSLLFAWYFFYFIWGRVEKFIVITSSQWSLNVIKRLCCLLVYCIFRVIIFYFRYSDKISTETI